jgi:hypothetical protein
LKVERVTTSARSRYRGWIRDAGGARKHYGAARPWSSNVWRMSAVSISTRYVLIASMDVTAQVEPLFNEVYDTEHVPNLLKVPGVP